MLEYQAGERSSESGAGWAGSIQHAAFRRDEGNLNLKRTIRVDIRNGARMTRERESIRGNLTQLLCS